MLACAGSWSGHGTCRPGQSEKHSRSPESRKLHTKGFKIKNMAHLVQGKNIRSRVETIL